jgi:hypothetical protein
MPTDKIEVIWMHKITLARKGQYLPWPDGKEMDVEDSGLERHDRAGFVTGCKESVFSGGQ